ncbi:hypothetical protein [Pseudophaeobacter sp.]|uniref:hypothetical protein n=1 Tax=Pseudophaeobacter sp. TaxID=1971739 RepID=UPI0032973314
MVFSLQRGLIAGVSSLGLMAGTAQADQVILDDLIVNQSICVGNDCVNGESFGFDTIRMKENNLRIHAVDTSTTSSFPTVDWQLTFNDSGNGGQNKFSVDNIDTSQTPLTIISGAPSHSVFVQNSGHVGFGTATPVLDLHVRGGNSPALRLEQDGSSGFTPQSWDVAGNETNFFVRDATNGSRIPFKIRPAAPNNALYVDTDGDVGLGTASPDAGLHLLGNGMLIESTDTATAPTALMEVRGDTHITGGGNLLVDGGGSVKLSNAGLVNVLLSDSSHVGPDLKMVLADGTFRLSFDGTGVAEMELFENGNMIIPGNLITTGGGGACTAVDPCDAVFDPEVYQVPSIEEHAAEMWADKHLPAVGPTGPGIPVNVSEKMLRMLNELETAHIYIEQLNSRISELETRLNEG